MSPARPDSKPTTVTAAAADIGARPAPGRAESPERGRRAEVEPTVTAATANRRQIVLVAQVLASSAAECGDAGAKPAITPADPVAGCPDLFGHAVVDVHEVSEAFGGETIAVLGNRVVAAFPYDQAADAVTAAVEIQRDAARSASGAHHWACAVGLVAGEVVDHPAFERIGLQPVASVVDRAVVLSSSASPGSVLADERTALPAVGTEPARDGGDAKKAPAAPAAGPPAARPGGAERGSWSLGANRVVGEKGDDPITCYEIVFDAHTPARAARVAVSRSAPSGGNRPPNRGGSGRRGRAGGRVEGRPAPSVAALRRRPWSEGRVFCWFVDRGRGVITSTTGQEFYVDRRFLAVGSELAAGDRVFFVPRDPVARGRNPVAGAVLGDGARLEVRVEKSAEEDGLALAVVSDSNGTDQVLPVDVTSLGAVSAGEWLLVRITARDGRPLGRPV